MKPEVRKAVIFLLLKIQSWRTALTGKTYQCDWQMKPFRLWSKTKPHHFSLFYLFMQFTDQFKQIRRNGANIKTKQRSKASKKMGL